MKSLNTCLLTVLFLALPFLSTEFSAIGKQDVTAITGVNVLTMESETILENQTILIENGRISVVDDHDSVDIPEGAVTISGPFYVMPGLAEMHAHIPSQQQGEAYMLDALKLYLSQGVTTIRGMLGEPAHLDMRERAAAKEIVSPRIYTSGPSFNANSVDDPESGRQMVRDQAEAGYDLLKFHPGLSLEIFEAVTDEANQIGIEFSGHISHAVGLQRSLDTGKGSIDHLDRYMEFLAGDPADRTDPPIIYFGYDLTYDVDTELIPEAARLTAEAGVWNVPTNTLLENVFNPDLTTGEMSEWPGMEFLPPQLLDGWVQFVNRTRNQDDYDEDKARRFLELRKMITLELHRQGAGLMLGADAPQIFNPPGFSAHRELALLVDAGLSPFEALKTGTVNVGKYLGKEDRVGKVLPGFDADLLLLDSNPLEHLPDHERIQGVMVRGEWFSRETLDEMLAEILERYGG